MKRFRKAAPWAISFLLHVMVLVVLWRHPPPPKLNFASRQPVTVEIIHVAKKPAPRTAPALTPPPPQPSRDKSKQVADNSPPSSAPPPPSGGRSSGTDTPKASAPSTRAPVASLMPNINTPGGDIGIPIPADEHGHLLHNRPGEVPSEAEKLAQEKHDVKQRTEGWANDVLAERRVTNGIVSEYFNDLAKALSRATAHPPPIKLPFAGSGALKAYANGMENFGKTGSPMAGESPRDDATDPISQLAAGQERNEGRPGSSMSEGYANTAQMLATTRMMKDAPEPGVTAIIELFQKANGALADIKLLNSSGDLGFDKYVLSSAPVALTSIAGPTKEGVGVHLEGMHTIWAFTGTRVFTKDVRDVKREDAPRAVGMGALGVLTGQTTFDETGKVQIADLGDPHYKCKVKLLRVY